MRFIVRSVGIGLLTAVAAGLLTVSLTVTNSVQLLASYGVKGTQLPGITVMTDQEFGVLAAPYLAATDGAPPTPFSVVDYPASAFPLSGLFTETADQSEAKGLAALQHDSAADPARPR